MYLDGANLKIGIGKPFSEEVFSQPLFDENKGRLGKKGTLIFLPVMRSAN
jgi:hypothetical protein